MATRMTDTDRTTDVVSRGPRVWPWVLLAVVVALGLWWAAAHNNSANNANYNNSTQPYGMTPGTGTTGSATGGSGLGTPGTGDMGGVGTPSPAPTTPSGTGAGQ